MPKFENQPHPLPREQASRPSPAAVDYLDLFILVFKIILNTFINEILSKIKFL